MISPSPEQQPQETGAISPQSGSSFPSAVKQMRCWEAERVVSSIADVSSIASVEQREQNSLPLSCVQAMQCDAAVTDALLVLFWFH